MRTAYICDYNVVAKCIFKESKFTNLPSVNVKIVRATDLLFPLTPENPTEETINIPVDQNVNITFNGGKNHTQEYNPRQLFLSFNGTSVYAAMGTYSRVNDSGTFLCLTNLFILENPETIKAANKHFLLSDMWI